MVHAGAVLTFGILLRALAAGLSMYVWWIVVDVAGVARAIDTNHQVGCGRNGFVAERVVAKVVVVEIRETGAVDNGTANFTGICPHHLWKHKIQNLATIVR